MNLKKLSETVYPVFIQFNFFFQNYDTSESKLRREFEVYGTIKKIIVIQNAETGKPRGYAFIEYEHERDMHCEYKFIIFSGKIFNKISRAEIFLKTFIFNLEQVYLMGLKWLIFLKEIFDSHKMCTAANFTIFVTLHKFHS